MFQVLYLHSPVERSSDGISTGRAILCFWNTKKTKNPRRSRPTVCLRDCKLSGSTRKKELCDNWASPACLQPSFRNKWKWRRLVKYSSSRQTTTATRNGSQTLTDRARPWPPIHNTLPLTHDSKPLSHFIPKKIYSWFWRSGGGRREAKQQKKREKSQIKMCRTQQTCEYTAFRLQLLGNKGFGGKPSLRGIFNVSLIATLADRHISLLISGHDYRLRQ